jgi:diguanylate cyclase (GGDEF)-like protein/PAS domain S-box-containing protein
MTDGKLLRESQGDILPHLVDACPDAIIGVNTKGMVTIFNPAAAALTGHTIEDAVGKMHITRFYKDSNDARMVKSAIYSEEFGGKNRLVGYETEIIDSVGNIVPIRLSSALLVENGKETGSVGFFHDMTVQKKLEEKLRTLSITDGLTGLYNQRHFYTCLSNELSRAIRHSRPLGIIGFDLDKFKECNDNYGHLEGDNVLRLIGDVLISETRKSDLSFRYGGDEFFVLLPEANREQIMTVAEKILRVFKERWPYDSAAGRNGQFLVGLSMGVIQRTDESDPLELIHKIDVLIYAAKKSGGNRVVGHPAQ